MISVFTDEDGKDIGGGYVTSMNGIGGDIFLVVDEFPIQLNKLEVHVREKFPDVEGIVITDDIEGIEKSEYRRINSIWYLEF